MPIVTLTTSESGANSRTILNDNFTDVTASLALKANLASPTFTGTPTLPTGTIAVTQSASNNSTKVATTAYVDAAIPAVITCLTLIPLSNISGGGTGVGSSLVLSSNTLMHVGQIIIPFKITVNKATIRRAPTGASAGTYDITMYSEDGQTQIFSVTTADAATGDIIYTTSVASVVVNPGIYWIAINPNSNASSNDIYFYTIGSAPYTVTSGIPSDVTSEPIMQGTITISAGAPPATISPTSVAEVISSTLIVRLDN